MPFKPNMSSARALGESVRIPHRAAMIVITVIAVLAVVFTLLRIGRATPIDVSWIYYPNTLIVYGLWVGFILFFMLYSLRRETSFPASPPETRFICLIPAYSESVVISNSVKSLLSQDYPKALFDVVVVFDGRDDTGDIAEALGARVIKTPSPGSGKHQALVYAVDRLVEPDDQRYVVVIDADNVVVDSFLQKMNDAILGGGYQCLQANHDVLNNEANWITRALWCATAASSRLYNQGRFNSIGNALVCGTGWCCKAGLARTYLPMLRTQTEDIELNGVLLLNEGVRVAWVPDAKFYDEKPQSVWVAVQQRRRWMVGHMRVFGLLAWPCTKAAFRRRSAALLEMALYYAVPFAMSVSIIQLFAIHTGISLGVLSVRGPLAATTCQVILGAITVMYVFVYQVIGFGLAHGHWFRSVRYAAYTIFFSVIVWTLALVWSWFSLSRRDWMFHTPHAAVRGGVGQPLIETMGERA